MSDQAYEDLALAMDRLPNGYPRTTSGVEIRILEKIFTPDEAALAARLTGHYETFAEISARTGLAEDVFNRTLIALAQRGLVWFEKSDGRARFRLAPFVVGIYEASMHLLDHELAHLVEDYFREGGAKGIMGYEPALHRVVPAQDAIKSEWIMPYDDLRSIILACQSFNVRDCICRVERDLVGETCHFPVHTCINFSESERPAQPGDVSQAEALELLDKWEEIGLVHTVNNVAKGVFYVCNCCGCCCGILRGITEYGLPNSVARANYYAVIDPVMCAGCGTCIERCQVKAISDVDGISVVDRELCIGCGLCVTGCPNDVALLERKADAETIHPPADFSDWEARRLRNRGMLQ